MVGAPDDIDASTLLRRWSGRLPVPHHLGYPPHRRVATLEELAEERDDLVAVLAARRRALGLPDGPAGRAAASGALLADVAGSVLALPALALAEATVRWTAGIEDVAVALDADASVTGVGWVRVELAGCGGCDLAELVVASRLELALGAFAEALVREGGLTPQAGPAIVADAGRAGLAAAVAG